MQKKFSLFTLLFVLCAFMSRAQQQVNIHLDIQIENYTDNTSVMIGQKVSSMGWSMHSIGDINADGHLSKEVSVTLPAGENDLPLSISLIGVGWNQLPHRFYAHPGSRVLVTAQDKQPQTIRIESDSELDKSYRQFLKLTARSTALVDECKEKIDSLVNITVETDEEYLPIEKALKVWRKKQQEADKVQKREQLQALQKLPFNAVWKEMLSDITVFFSHGDYSEFYPLVEEALKAVPFEEKSKPWYIDQLSLIHPGELYAMNDVVDAELEDLEGNSYTLSQFRGKYVLLDFWGEACAPCEASIPELSELSKKLEDQIVFVSITQDYNDAEWRTATNRHTKEEFCWYNLRDKHGKGGLWARNAVNSMPTFVLLSPEGKKLDQVAGYADGYIFQFLKPHLKLKSEATVTILNKSGEPTVDLLGMTALNGVYQQVKKDSLTLTGQLEVKVPVDNISLFELVCPGGGMMEFPVERNRHYTVSFTGDSFQWEGEEHPAQKLYTELYKEPSARYYASAFMGCTTADSLLAAVDKVRVPMSNKVLQAYKEKKMSTALYTFIQHDIDCYWRTIMGIVSAYISSAEADKMWQLATEGIDANAQLFRQSHSLNDFLHAKADKLLSKDRDKMTEIYNKGLLTTAYIEKYRTFLKAEMLEHQYAYTLYATMIQNNYEAELLTLFQDFKQMFPESAYLPVLESFIPAIEAYNHPKEHEEAGL